MELGTDEVINPKEEAPVAKVKDLAGGAGADVIIMCTGGSTEAPCTEEAARMATKGRK